MTALTTGSSAPPARSPSLETYTTFQLRGGLFGIATSVVKEVTALPPLTPIPHAPAAIRGYVNLRGHIVLVVDLNCLLRRAATVLDAACRLVVLKPDLGDPFGVLVERIGDIVDLPAGQIETHHAPQPGGGEAAARPEQELVCGVGKLAAELVSILDARQLRPGLQRAVAARAASGPEAACPDHQRPANPSIP